MSLREFHLLFIVLAMLGADLFGVWTVWNYLRSGDRGLLALGAVAVLGGIGLLLYATRIFKRLDEVPTH